MRTKVAGLRPYDIQTINTKMAEFIGLIQDWDGGWYYYLDSSFTLFVESTDELNFDSDYNQLMKVVDFVEKLERTRGVYYNVNISKKHTTIDVGSNTLGVEGTVYYSGIDRFNALYFALNEFINWYNKKQDEYETK